MPKSLTDKERINKGQVLVRIIIEVLGAPKEYVEEAIQLVVDKINKSKDLEVVSESTFEAEEKGKLFSTFSEVEIWFDDLDALTRFAFDFTPSSIEVLQPATLNLSGNFVSGLFNDFLLKMHDVGLKLKDQSAKTQLLQKNADALVRNFLNASLKEPKDSAELARITGIPEDNIKGMMGNFEKAGIVKVKDGKFVLVKKS